MKLSKTLGKRVLSLLIVGLFVFTAFAVIQSGGGQAQASPSASSSFTFPYQYGTPTVPSDVGAQGIQGPTVPSSDIGYQGNPGNSGHVGIIGVNNSWIFKDTPITFHLHVFNGTPSSSTPAVKQSIAFQNVSTGKYVPGITSSTGWANITITAGYWSLRVNASSSSYINFRSYYALDVSSSFDSLNVYLIPSADGTASIGNGGTDTIYAEGMLPQVSIELLNESSSGSVLATAQTISNGTAEFTDVSGAYSYSLLALGTENSITGMHLYEKNATIGPFSLSSAVTVETFDMRQDGENHGTATVTGYTVPAYGTWSPTANITISNGTYYVSGGIYGSSGITVKFVNDIIYLNASEFIPATEKTIIENSTVISIYESFVNGFGFSINRGGSSDNFYVSNSVFYVPFGNAGYPRMSSVLTPYVNNTAFVDTVLSDGDGFSGAANAYYSNDMIINSTICQPFNIKNSQIYNSTLGGETNNINLTVYNNIFVNSTYYNNAQGNGYVNNVSAKNNYIVNPVGFNVNVLRVSSGSAVQSGNSSFTFNSVIVDPLKPFTNLAGVGLTVAAQNVSNNYVNGTATGMAQYFSFNLESPKAPNGSRVVSENNIMIQNYTDKQLVEYDNSTHYNLVYDFYQVFGNVVEIHNHFVNYGPVLNNATIGSTYNAFTDVKGNATFSNNLFTGPGEGDDVWISGNTPSPQPSYIIIDNNTFTGAHLNETVIENLYGSLPPDASSLILTIDNSTYQHFNITDNTLNEFLSGAGLPAFLQLYGGFYAGYYNVSYNVFNNVGVTGPTPDKYINNPYTVDIVDETWTHERIVGNWFLDLNNMTRPWVDESIYPLYLSNNHYFVSPPPTNSYNKLGYVPVVNYATTSLLNETYAITVGKGSPLSGSYFLTNTSAYLSPSGQPAGYLYSYAPDVNTLSGMPTISYSNGFVGGPQPNFTWKGYNYSESVEPSYIQVGVNSSKAPSIGLQFQGIADALYDIEMFNNGSLISSYQESATSLGVLNATYNPATMPLDPIFYVQYVGSGVVPPPVVTPLVPIVPHVLFGIPYLNVIVLFGGIVLASEEFFRTQAKGNEKRYSYTGVFVGIMIAGIGLMSVL
jgi:hypothetical protein